MHIIRIDVNKLIKHKNNGKYDNEDHDYLAEMIIESVQNIRQNDCRFRSRSNRDGNGTISKFMATNEYKACFDDDNNNKIEEHKDTQDTEEQETVCFVDGFFDELAKQGADTLSISKLETDIITEQFDTDGICNDLFDEINGWNIRKYIDECAENEADAKLINELCTNHYIRYIDINSEYSVSFRFFYWPFYKNNTNTINVLYKYKSGKQLTKSNEGYRLCDWYISVKYESLKEEITNNLTAPFSLSQWTETYTQAMEKLSA